MTGLWLVAKNSLNVGGNSKYSPYRNRAVSRSPEFAAAREVVEQAQRDADDTAEISLATGMLMANQTCTAEQAAGLLQQAADADGETILKIAQRIITEQRNSL